MTATGAKQVNSTITSKAICPRCGYDLRGTIETWSNHCPLMGRCNECGLEFEWADILSSRRRIPSWNIESASQIKTLVYKTAPTLFHNHWPWNFWSSMRMAHEIKHKRIIVYLLILMIVIYVLFAICHGIIARYNFVNNLQWGRASTTEITALVQAAVAPWWPKSPGFIVASWGTSPIESPFELFVRYWLPFVPQLTYMLGFQLCCALGFAALPVSRKVAKVRWVHIWRVASYGLGLMFIPVTVTIVVSTIEVANAQYLNEAFADIAIYFIWILVPMYFIWWSIATSRYLKMRHAWAVGLAVCVMALIAPYSAVGLYWLVDSFF